MKKFLFLFMLLSILFSCKKNSDLPAATLQTSGILHYDNFPDGWGLYYAGDNNEVLIFKNMFSSDSAQYQYFKDYVNQHSRLSYHDNGEKGCLYGFGPVCGIRVVEVVDLKK